MIYLNAKGFMENYVILLGLENPYENISKSEMHFELLRLSLEYYKTINLSLFLFENKDIY